MHVRFLSKCEQEQITLSPRAKCLLVVGYALKPFVQFWVEKEFCCDKRYEKFLKKKRLIYRTSKDQVTVGTILDPS